MITRPELTNDDLDKIKLPLSEEDYQMLKSSIWDYKYRKELTEDYDRTFEVKALTNPMNVAYSDLA